MWEIVKQILEKLACKHEWKLTGIHRVYGYDYQEGDLPIKVTIDYLCEKCGKFKRR